MPVYFHLLDDDMGRRYALIWIDDRYDRFFVPPELDHTKVSGPQPLLLKDGQLDADAYIALWGL